MTADDRLAVWIATHRYAPLDGLLVGLGTIDRLGAVWVVLALAVGVAQRRRPLAVVCFALLVGLATFVADSASFGVKDLVFRTRPFVAHPVIHPLYAVHSSSFPAGHAATAFAGATLLSYAAPRLRVLFVALAAIIAYSRVYVGVHYPGDVLGGAMLGALVGCVAIAAVEGYRARSASTRGRSRPRAASAARPSP